MKNILCHSTDPHFHDYMIITLIRLMDTIKGYA